MIERIRMVQSKIFDIVVGDGKFPKLLSEVRKGRLLSDQISSIESRMQWTMREGTIVLNGPVTHLPEKRISLEPAQFFASTGN